MAMGGIGVAGLARCRPQHLLEQQHIADRERRQMRGQGRRVAPRGRQHRRSPQV